MEATLSSKGQATIPKTVRDRLQIKPGDRFKFFFHPDGVIILPKIPTARLKGMIPQPAKSVSLQEIDRAIEDGATQRFRRKKWLASIQTCFYVTLRKTTRSSLPAQQRSWNGD